MNDFTRKLSIIKTKCTIRLSNLCLKESFIFLKLKWFYFYLKINETGFVIKELTIVFLIIKYDIYNLQICVVYVSFIHICEYVSSYDYKNRRNKAIDSWCINFFFIFQIQNFLFGFFFTFCLCFFFVDAGIANSCVCF